MFYNSLLIRPIVIVYLTVSTFFVSSASIAQDSPIPNSILIPPSHSPKETSNLITNNPFVPKNNALLNNVKTPPEPQSLAKKLQVLNKYLQFRSIAIINKKKYFSIFNKRTNKSFWIEENETVDNLRVTNYNELNNTISITDGINTETISIITPDETPLSVIGTPSKASKEATKAQFPGTTENQDKEKHKTLPRRRVIPAKR